jgi:hypothetical protein
MNAQLVKLNGQDGVVGSGLAGPVSVVPIRVPSSKNLQGLSPKHVEWVLSKSKNDLIAASFALGVTVNELRTWMLEHGQGANSHG